MSWKPELDLCTILVKVATFAAEHKIRESKNYICKFKNTACVNKKVWKETPF